jgi:phenylacetate-coenzyme A ligase PaaK-like adenylate-forming protein
MREPCECGRMMARMSKVKARTDDSVLHPDSIQRSEGKAKRVIDKRELTR